MAHHLASDASLVSSLGRGGRCLELGAGLGVVGLAAAKCHGCQVLLSDLEEKTFFLGGEGFVFLVCLLFWVWMFFFLCVFLFRCFG